MTAAPAEFRCVVKVRTNSMTRILNNITHPTELGASAMQLSLKEGKQQVSATTCLLLDILREEAGADLRIPDVNLSEHFSPAPQKPVKATQHISNTFPAACELGRDYYIPPPPPALVCEFDLGIGNKKNRHGRFTSIIFWMLVFSFEGGVRLNCEATNNDGREAGDNPETSGVWRAAPGHQRSAQETRRAKHPGRCA